MLDDKHYTITVYDNHNDTYVNIETDTLKDVDLLGSLKDENKKSTGETIIQDLDTDVYANQYDDKKYTITVCDNSNPINHRHYDVDELEDYFNDKVHAIYKDLDPSYVHMIHKVVVHVQLGENGKPLITNTRDITEYKEPTETYSIYIKNIKTDQNIEVFTDELKDYLHDYVLDRFKGLI